MMTDHIANADKMADETKRERRRRKRREALETIRDIAAFVATTIAAVRYVRDTARKDAK
jgi:hypothetical protein